MDCIRVFGGRPLSGEVRIHGGKNAALPILAAAASIPGQFLLRNCPHIRDVEITRALLHGLGAKTRWQAEGLYLDTSGVCRTTPDPTLAGCLRSSVLLLGALLSRFGTARIPLPGGCVLGRRPLDLHLIPLEEQGVRVSQEQDALCCNGRPRGGTVILSYPSVGATENLILSGLGAGESLRIIGAAREPEIADLIRFLRACGGRLSGEGTNCVTVSPGCLHGTEYAIQPDRMEAATYLCAAACAGGKITLRGAERSHLLPVLRCLEQAGCTVRVRPDALTLSAGDLHAIGPILTAPYPGFPTDAQAPMMAALLRAEGTTILEETVFENRFRHVPALRRLGAKIDVAGQLACVRGVPRLRGCRMEATDLRGGAAMVLAALGAEGESLITNAVHMQRGYESFAPTLAALGADISEERTKEIIRSADAMTLP